MSPETATQLFQAATHRGSGSQTAVVEECRTSDRSHDAYVVGPALGSMGAWSGTVSLDALMLLAAGVGADERLSGPRALFPRLQAARIHLLSSRRVRTDRHLDASQLASHLSRTLEEAPVESGFTHAGESLLAEAFEANAPEARAGLAAWYQGLEDLEQAQALLLLARVNHPAAIAMVRELSREGLTSSDLEVREAAIHALEAVAGPESVELLRGHRDSDPVLAEYVQRVLKDLAG